MLSHPNQLPHDCPGAGCVCDPYVTLEVKGAALALFLFAWA
jgi:hypothetical protein